MVYLGASYYGPYDLIYDEYTVWKKYVTYNPIKGEDLVKQINLSSPRFWSSNFSSIIKR